MKIRKIFGRQILDSRGQPTVEADVILQNGLMGRASIPSGASTGTYEALELRDNDPKKYYGKSVLKAVSNINTKISRVIVGLNALDQKKIDLTMINLDGTQNKSNLGANAILAVSLASAKAAATQKKLHFFEYLALIAKSKKPTLMPVPQMNVINGGAHAQNSTDIQEFMIIPKGAKSFSDALRMGAEIFQCLKEIFKKKGLPTTVGDEGGFPLHANQIKNPNIKALDLLTLVVAKAGYKLGKDVVFALDVAATEFYKNNRYVLKSADQSLTTDQMISYLKNLTKKYKIASIEDGLAEGDWDGWVKLNKQLGKRIQIVGDDLFVTNPKFLQKGIKLKAGNAIIIKLNQIGTLTETIQTINMAKKAGWNTIIAHRSGETEDTTIADLSVGLSAGQIKTSLSRSERLAKYNQLLRIEEILGKRAEYGGFSFG